MNIGSVLSIVISHALATPPVVEPALVQLLDRSAEHSSYAIVVLKSTPGSTPGQLREEVLAGVGAEFRPVYQFKHFAAVTGRLSRSGLRTLSTDERVSFIGADEIVRTGLDTSVPFIHADVVHSFGLTGHGQTVAVIDSGVESSHPDLADSIAPEAWHFLYQGEDVGPGAEDYYGHGTLCAGVITSNGIIAPRGVAPDADVLPVQTMDGTGFGYLSDIAAAVDYVIGLHETTRPIAAISISLGSFPIYNQCPCDNVSASAQLMAIAIQAARNAGVLTFAATLNDGSCAGMTSPACLSPAVAVAGVYDAPHTPDCTGPGLPDEITCESNRSPCNKLAAPGADITTTFVGGGTITGSGTSFAAPHVAAVAALLREKDARDCDLLSANELLQIMIDTSVPTIDRCSVFPHPVRVDALAALQAVPLHGDFNEDHQVSQSDTTEFVLALLEGQGIPGGFLTADANCDGRVDGQDVAAFVTRLLE